MMLLARDVVKNLRATGLYRETSSSLQVHRRSGWKTSCSPKGTLLLQSAHAAAFPVPVVGVVRVEVTATNKEVMAPKPGSHGAILLAISQLRRGSCVRKSMVEAKVLNIAAAKSHHVHQTISGQERIPAATNKHAPRFCLFTVHY